MYSSCSFHIYCSTHSINTVRHLSRHNILYLLMADLDSNNFNAALSTMRARVDPTKKPQPQCEWLLFVFPLFIARFISKPITLVLHIQLSPLSLQSV